MQFAATVSLALFVAVAAGAAVPAEDVPVCIAKDDVAGATGRPRVGLVLGGGGARGAAHVGVLRELERMRIPVDAIVGTSIGAIVGGLYASGMSVDQLEETLATLDWADAMSDRPDRSDLSFRRKKDDEQFPIAFELGFHEGEIRLPQGVIQGHTLDLILRDLTMHTAFVDDFDDLPIPFRAIASDIVKGEPYVMGDGDLALAIRASMSVPGAFSPVKRDGRLLVDGGLVGNLGVNVVQDMCVDVIIAVDVEFPLYAKEELDSAVAISEQMLTLLIRKETLRQIENLGPRDILIRPDLGTFGSMNFKDVVETIEPGAAATRAAADQLAVVAIDDAAFRRYSAQRTGMDMPQENLAFVRIVHDVKVAPEILTARMDLIAGDPIDPDSLAREADRLFGLQLFERVGYRLVREDGGTGVEFTAVSKSWGPNYLRFGLSLENDFEGSTAINFTTRWRRPELNSLGAELLTDLQLGTDPLIAVEFYQPLRFDSRIFVAPTLTARQTSRNFFVNNDAVARLRFSEAVLELDAGAEIGNAGEFRIGVFRGTGKGRVQIGDPVVPNLDFESGGLRTQLRIDTFDNAQFPRSGTRAGLIWTASRPGLGADTRFDTVEFEADSAFSRGKNTLVAGLSYSTTVDSISPIQNYFPLGGFLRLSGLDRGQISGPHAGLARLVYFRQVGNPAGGLLEMPLYIGASLEAGNVWQNRQDVSFGSLLTNGSLFLGLDSLVGPLYLAAGFSESGDTSFYLFIGATPR